MMTVGSTRQEGLKKTGSPLPRGATMKEGFVVKTWSWNPMDQDYTLENTDTGGHFFFKNYADADEYFEQAGFPEMKIELIQYKYGLRHVVKSRIDLPQMKH